MNRSRNSGPASSRHRAVTITAIYAVLAAAWIYASDALLELFVSDVAVLSRIAMAKGWLFVAITSALLYFFARSAPRSERDDDGDKADERAFSLVPPLAVLFVFAALVALSGYFIYTRIERAAHVEAQEKLEAIVALKAGQLSDWLEGLRGNAERTSDDAFLAEEVESWLARGAPPDAAAGRLRERLDALRSTHGWSHVYLLDERGQSRLESATRVSHIETATALAGQAIRTRETLFRDFHRHHQSDQIAFAFFSPLLTGSGNDHRATGVVVQEMLARDYLRPLIDRWPLPSKSGETMLVRSDGDSVLYLTELRHRKGAALSLRIPRASNELAAAKAIAGDGSPIEGLDYRGKAVFAASRPIPRTPWILVAKIDRDEVNGPVARSGRLVALFGFVLIAAGSLTVTFWLRQQRAIALVRNLRAERERNALAKHLDYLTRYANDMILLLDDEGRILDANERAVSAWGYTREELLGSHIRTLRAPGSLEDFAGQWTAAASEGGTIFETVHRRKDGSEFPVEVSSRAITIEGATLRQSIIRDISERKTAEEALRASEEKFRLVFNNERDAISLVDAETTRILEVNEAFTELSGYTNEEAKQLYVRDVSAEPEHSKEAIRKAVANGMERVPVRRFRKKDGTEIWVDLRLSTFAWRGRQLVVSILRDMTAAKRAEESQLLWAKVLEDSAEGIVITGADRKILTVNKAFTTMTGYSPEEVIGRDPKILQSGRNDAAFYHVMWRTIRESSRWQGEIWNRKKNGELYLEWLSITAVHNAEGQLTHYVGIFSDVTERKESADRIQFLASHDALTALPNRVLMNDIVRQALAASRRRETMLALLFIDLDRFKTINDSLGHTVGDTLLRSVADRLTECTREDDTVARLGGDEFLVLIPDIARSQDAAVVAEKIATVMREPFPSDGPELRITSSIGISVAPHDGVEVAALIRNAEAAMYHAKASGRNNYQFFTSDMNARAFEALSMEMSLRSAIDRNEFTLHYQPEVNTRTGRIVGVEALIRWQHRDLGSVPPSRFIPIAEEHGLIASISEWALRAACTQTRRWLDEGVPAVPVAVNISAVHFRQPGLASRVAAILSECGVEPRYLELEITEGIIMSGAEQAIEVLNELSRMGVSLSIDDFGTGYSSLSYLRRFPIRKLKIDRSFVSDITSNPDAASIATAIIGMARSLKLRVIAEGVETAGQLDFLRRHGCDELQGFHIARPMEAADFAKLLREGEPLVMQDPAMFAP